METIEHYLGLTGSPAKVMAAISEFAGTAVADAAAAAWRARLEAAGLDPEKVVLATRFARAFGYYDGFLFEVLSAALTADAPVAAGGRYDGLFAQLGGAASTAVGCMVRPARAWRGAP